MENCLLLKILENIRKRNNIKTYITNASDYYLLYLITLMIILLAHSLNYTI